MHYEVELKFPVPNLIDIEARLSAMGAEISAGVLQVDIYLSHPARDFAATDEALRIRRVGDANVVTYKGPKVDAGTKTRREIELAIEPGDDGAAPWIELFEVLGFRPVAEVRKRRRPARIPWQGALINGALDDVIGLGAFIELEVIAGDDAMDEARSRLRALASALGLTRSERRSYLELLLERP